MALFSSSVFSEIRGSIGGTTYTRNASGMIARQRVKPVDPQTNAQSECRSRFGGLADTWSNVLTQAQRDGWDAAGAQTLVPNKLGNMVPLSGFAFFGFVNNLLLEGEMANWTAGDAAPMALLADAPLPGYGLAIQYTLTGTFTTPTAKITYNTIGETYPDDAAVIARRSPLVRPSVMYYTGPWVDKMAINLPAGGGGTDLFTALVAGGKYFVQITHYSFDSSVYKRRALSEIRSVTLPTS